METETKQQKDPSLTEHTERNNNALVLTKKLKGILINAFSLLQQKRYHLLSRVC